MSQTHLVVHDRGRDLAGVVHEGESWAAAARRTVASLHLVPEPVDLSGEVKQFVVDHDHLINLRAMEREDLALVGRWQGEDDAALERRALDYGPSIDGLTSGRLWIAEVNGRPAGFLADSRAEDGPGAVVSVDYALGPEWSDTAFGPRVLWAWMARTHHRLPEAQTFVSAPRARDERSRETLARAGFDVGTGLDTVGACTLDVRRVLG